MTHQSIWFLNKLPEETCDRATKEFELIPTKDAAMGIDGELTKHTGRDTTICFVPPNNWFTDIMYEFGVQSNKICGWNFDITTHENIQYATYEPGQHYDWHIDTFFLSLPEKSSTDRKVTVVCLMNDVSEFEEGELQIGIGGSDYTVPLEKGSIVAFPSFLYHRVIPIKSGVRKSSTMWLSGPRFR
jgi:PKHD-type hydroxylase